MPADVQRLNSIKTKVLATLSATAQVDIRTWHTVPFCAWLRAAIGDTDLAFLYGYLMEVGPFQVDDYLTKILNGSGKYSNLVP